MARAGSRAEDERRIVARGRAGFTSEDIHRAVFPDGPPKRRTLEDMKEGIRRRIRERYGRR
jgi:hypothetical protein